MSRVIIRSVVVHGKMRVTRRSWWRCAKQGTWARNDKAMCAVHGGGVATPWLPHLGGLPSALLIDGTRRPSPFVNLVLSKLVVLEERSAGMPVSLPCQWPCQ